MKYGQPVAYRLWKTPKPTKRVPEPMPKADWNRGWITSWMKNPKGRMFISVKDMKTKIVYRLDSVDVDENKNL